MGGKDAETVFNEADRDGSGFVDFGEFLRLISTFMKEPYTKDELIEAFSIFDQDKSGLISAKELKNVCMQTGDKLSDSEIDEILENADTNSDGMLSIEEFAQMLLIGQRGL